MSKLFRFSYLHWLLIFALVGALDLLWLKQGQILDQTLGDIVLRQHAKQRPASSDLVVIDVDQKSLEDMISSTGSWPWPRAVHGELIETIARQRPRAIVFDIMFSERDLYRNDSDRYLAEVIAAQRNVYLPMVLTRTGVGSVPNSALPKTLAARPTPQADPHAMSPLVLPIFDPSLWRGGMINFLADSDHIGRHYYLYVEDRGWRFPSLPASLATDFQWGLPDSDRIMLNWRQAPLHVSYVDIYMDGQRAKPLRSSTEFTDKIVVIGTAAPGLQDLRPTPIGPTYPGVDVLALAIDNLRNNDWLREITRINTLPWLLLLLLGVGLAFQRGWSVPGVASLLAVATLGTLLFAWWRLGKHEWWPVYSALTWAWLYYLFCTLLAYLAERRRREQAIRMFQRFLDPRVVNDLLARGEIDHAANAQSRDVTVLFSDIRGFTALSETRTPAAVVELLNRYFSTQVEVIFRHGGTLDKFIGDAIMAFWGAPGSNPDHARHAVAAAIEMGEALQAFAAELSDLGTTFDIGIGLNSGPAVVGFIGSDERRDYTVIGDTVNLASRIEGQTKGIARVLISESTRQAAGAAFDYRDCGEHHVKGREQGVRLYEPRKIESI